MKPCLSIGLIVLFLHLSCPLICQVEKDNGVDETKYHLLFSAVHPDTAQPLNSIEKRMRIARLTPFPSGLTIDLSGGVIFNFFDGVEYAVQLKRKAGVFYDGMEVWTGRAEDHRFDHLEHYVNTIVVVNLNTEKMAALVQTDKGYFQMLPTAVKNEYRISQYKEEPFACSVLPGENDQTDELSAIDRTVCGSACLEEIDADGKYVIDLFMGYSTSAAAAAGDINAHAMLRVQSVNTAFENSQVTTTYLRLVGTGITTNNPGIVTSVLTDCYTWFAPEIETLAPDIVGVFQTPTGAPGEAGGWANIGQYSNVNSINLPDAFRHEMGHNAGGSHCPGDGGALFGYAHGYNNGNWQTHLCGNAVNYWSNPDVNDDQGNPIGDPATADMARVWDERAPIMAQHRLHRVEYFPGDDCVNQICIPYHVGSQNELIKRVVFNTIDNDQASPGWNCPSITGYSDYTDISTEIHQNSSYLITITPNFSFASSKVGVWIDWNNDGLLSTTERVGNFVGVGPWSQMVTVPPDAYLGAVRLRIRLQFGAQYTPDPCGPSGFTSGETEDYTAIVAAALPISLLYFKGQHTEAGNLLSWRTEEEINASHFVVERSTTTLAKFESIGQVKVEGNPSKYTFTDKNNIKGTCYYRLKMVDIDGKYEYSSIISITSGNSLDLVKAFPNPSTGRLSLYLPSDFNETVELKFLNTLGQQVLEFSVIPIQGDHSVSVDISTLPPGMYFCVVQAEDNAVSIARILKE